MSIYKSKAAKRKAGFSLLEVGIAVTLMAMIFIGTMTMYLSMARTTMRSQSEVFASAAAANALQYMVQQSREAFDFKLPEEQSTIDPNGAAVVETFQGISGYAASAANSNTPDPNYQATFTLSGTTQTINTAVVLYMPQATAAATSFLKSDGVTTYTYSPNGDVNHLLYNRQGTSPGNGIIYYRADKGGKPDPLQGQYLWMYSLWDSGATINKKLVQLFDTPAAAANVPNAVQFDRPTALPFQLELKIICGNYSPINGVQTNEETNGADASSLTGKCVLMRNHVLLPDPEGAGGNYTIPADNHWIAGT